jgi:predicted acylesterase/phospholipase RssA
MKIGVVLAGGGVYGAYQAGMLKALHEITQRKNIEIVAVSGTSVGALNGSIYVQDGNPDRLVSLWEGIKSSDILSSPLLIPFNMIKSKSMFSGKPLKKLINKYVDQSVINTKIRLHIHSINLFNRRIHSMENFAASTFESYLKYRIFKEYLYASAAIPVVFPPIKLPGSYCVDGGLKNNIPIDSLIDNHPECDKYIVLMCINPQFTSNWNTMPSGIGDISKRVSSIIVENLQERETSIMRSDKRIEIIYPQEAAFDHLIDFDKDKQFKAILAGEMIANRRLATILK